jgi:hypothetical protein
MKNAIRALLVGATLLAAATTVPALAQTNVSINIGQPGFYGRINIGDFGQAPVVYTQRPVIVRGARVRGEPLYLRVPLAQRNNWSRYCGRYEACGRPVMFVRDDWYTNTYAPQYRQRHGGPRIAQHDAPHYDQHGSKHGNKHDNKHDKHDGGRGNGHDNGNGHGNGHGNGNGRGH